MNYEFYLLHHVGVVAKRVCSAEAVAEAAAAHEGDDNTPSGPSGRRVKTKGSTHVRVDWREDCPGRCLPSSSLQLYSFSVYHELHPAR